MGIRHLPVERKDDKMLEVVICGTMFTVLVVYVCSRLLEKRNQ